MKKQSLIIFYILSALCLNFTNLHASKANPFSSQEEADCYLRSHYNLGCEHYNRQEWRQAYTHFEKVIHFFPCSDDAAEAAYYLAICYFEMKEYDFANAEFSSYLTASQHPAFFEDAVYYKFCIAEHFKSGKKRRPFKMRYLPKFTSAHDLALTIYDEVIAALPNHELTIRALYSKADLLRTMEEYRDSVETYQTIIRRFPRNEIVPDCYLNIAETYRQQSRYEFQNPDILAFAELNVRKFKDDFPRDERVALAEQSVCRIKEMYAKGLCDLGLFYERMEQPAAAAIYYQSSIEEFPDTHVAQFCRGRLACLGYNKEAEAEACCQEPSACTTDETSPSIPEQTDCSYLENFSLVGIEMACNENTQCGEDYYHYSVMKKNEASHVPFVPVPLYGEQDPTEYRIEGNQPQRVDDPRFEEDAPYILHYSQLKHRDQRVNCPE